LLHQTDISESVGLDPCQIKELSYSLVRRAHQLNIDLGINEGVVVNDEAMAAKKNILKGQAKKPPQTQSSCLRFERRQNVLPNSTISPLGCHGQGPNLAKIFPKNMECATSDDVAPIVNGNYELLHGLKEHNKVLAEQHTFFDQRLNKRINGSNIDGPRRPD
jgi:hypothetical protein